MSTLACSVPLQSMVFSKCLTLFQPHNRQRGRDTRCALPPPRYLRGRARWRADGAVAWLHGHDVLYVPSGEHSIDRLRARPSARRDCGQVRVLHILYAASGSDSVRLLPPRVGASTVPLQELLEHPVNDCEPALSSQLARCERAFSLPPNLHDLLALTYQSMTTSEMSSFHRLA